ncbi:SAM-dependent methyltransferase [Paenochrobactrum gallinarii]|uniref:SAM-dependent methyltransferase n=1 Tax=Paenochrobactrum gallinarii TaxID=643673 RepID=A0A841LVY0_9HYPH|nr:class I SAM-dependent methyltransferase [Paenochrobactrum gallinarii]MBB6262525.1 SAM-dependent methyltransferase [Paenochrobactrum gallinarii]
MNKPILDMCYGSRMFWFYKADDRALFGDIRAEEHVLCDGRHLTIAPDRLFDFRNLPFADSTFSLVVFDPPHLVKAGERSWIRAKYGALNRDTWRDDIRQGFSEAFRVLKADGTLIFKWNETQIKVREILALTDVKPVVGHLSGKASNTHWISFLKPEGRAALAQGGGK